MQVRLVKSNSSFQKKHTTFQITSGNIFFLGCTQRHAGLHPAKPVAHTGSQTEEATQGALPLSGVSFPV